MLDLSLVPVRVIAAALTREHPEHPVTVALAAGVRAFGTRPERVGTVRHEPRLTCRAVACQVRLWKGDDGRRAYSLATDETVVYCEHLAEPIEFRLTVGEYHDLPPAAGADWVTDAEWRDFRHLTRHH